MSNVSTFGGFATARLGIYASQKAMEVVGNNISNINTPNYTRQVLQQKALHVGGVDHYSITNDIRVGAGALCTGVTQLRDPYLDIRYRNENANVGAMDSKLAGLEALSQIFDEVGKGEEKDGVLELAMKKFRDAIQNHNTEGASRNEYNTITRSAAESVVDWFNDYAKQLETLQKNHEAAFQQDLKRVNTVLTGIRDLSEEIRKEEIHGGDALELKDERNALIDELSGYMRIHVTYSEEDIGAGMTVDKLKIEMADKSSVFGGVTLIDGIYGAQLSIQKNMVQGMQGDKPLWMTKSGNATSNENHPNLLIVDGEKVPYMVEDPEGADDPMFRLQVSALRDRHDLLKPGEIDRMKKADTDKQDTSYYLGEDGESYIKVGDNFMYGSLQSTREILTEKGEYSSDEDIAIDPDCTTKRGVPYYMKALDNLANIFAKWMNDANAMDYNPTTNPNVYWNKVEEVSDGLTHTTFYDRDPNAADAEQKGEFWALTTTDPTTNNKTTKYYKNDPTGLTGDALSAEEYTEAEVETLKTKLEKYVRDPATIDEMGAGVLFSRSGDGDITEGITARNLSISKSWSTDAVTILRTKDPVAFKGQSTNNDNLDHFVAIMEKSFQFRPSDVGVKTEKDEVIFEGSFFGMLTKLNSTLGTEKKSTEEALDNYNIATEDLYLAREGVSGVDLNDETIDMMKYQKSYTAACRLLTTLDEMLERLITGTGIAGR